MERIDKSHILTAKDVEAMPLIKAYADFLKRSGKIELPKLHDLMRASTLPTMRTAAIARHLYMRPCGINTLRDAFGTKHRNGVRHAYHDHVRHLSV
ncbi:hypothetical protein BLSTO_06123 [Blastocystis sp. subtype 1]